MNSQEFWPHKEPLLVFTVLCEHKSSNEGGATKCLYGHTFSLLYRDWMADKLDNRDPSTEETQVLKHLLALQPHCNVDFFHRALAAGLARDKKVPRIFQGSWQSGPWFRIRLQNVSHGPANTETESHNKE